MQVNEDALPESAENFHVDLTSATGATLQADKRGTATITDDDSAPTVTIGDPAAVTEGEVLVTFPVTLSAAAPAQVQIAWTTTDGTAVSPGDYTASNGTLTIPAGQSSGTIQVQVREDALPESAENFHVDLTSATGATLQADRRGTATITDDDTQPTATIGDVTVTEGHAGEVNANFPVTLSSAAPAPVQIAWTTTDGSATAASGDYDGATGTLTIRGGPVGRDDSGEGQRRRHSGGDVRELPCRHASATGALFTADRRGTATITDDDTAADGRRSATSR